MMKFRNWLTRVMYGRYGVDELYKLLFVIYIIIFIINLFLNNIVLEIIGLLIVLFMFYRVFSKKIYKRSNENQRYLKIRNLFLRKLKSFKSEKRDRNYIYKKCPKCRKILKLPLPFKRGLKHVVCPKCKKRLSLFVFRKQKIEIIKNKK